MFLTRAAKYSYNLAVGLHAHNCSVVKDNFDGTIGVGGEKSKSFDLEFTDDFIGCRHSLDNMLGLRQLPLNREVRVDLLGVPHIILEQTEGIY